MIERLLLGRFRAYQRLLARNAALSRRNQELVKIVERLRDDLAKAQADPSKAGRYNAALWRVSAARTLASARRHAQRALGMPAKRRRR